MLLSIVWNVDPVLIHFGDGGIRWYGLLWAIGLTVRLCGAIGVRMIALFCGTTSGPPIERL